MSVFASRSKKAGVHTGRVAVRASGSFNIQTGAGVVQGVSRKHCKVLMRADGYGYAIQPIVQPGKSVECNEAHSSPIKFSQMSFRKLLDFQNPHFVNWVYAARIA